MFYNKLECYIHSIYLYTYASELFYNLSYFALQLANTMITVINFWFLFKGKWMEFQNHRYYFSHESLNYSQARAYCHEQQAELTSINSFEENSFLVTETTKLG